MKKFLALILAVLMIAGSAVSVAAFDDVSGKYAEAIDGLQATGIVAGTSETTFTPDALVTRWQMALFMARAASAVTDDADWADGAKIFADCTQYLGAIQYCYGRGIIKGVTATEFAPDNNILFRDGIIMAIRALGYEKEDDGLEASAKKYNKTGAAYWTPYYERAIELGLLENLGNVAVDKALTRAETAQLIYNMIYTPVYAKDGANANNYTLYDVAFGGKAIVEVENSMKAWVAETPGYFFGETGTLTTDAEEIVIAWNAEEGIETTNVTFDDLAKWNIDVENIDEYFAATLEIINYDEENVADFEYLANFEKTEPTVLANSNVKYTYADNAVKYAKINSKTHYAANADAKNTIELYTVKTASDDLDEVVYEETAFINLDGKYFDLVVYDVDGDKYYEYGYVNFYTMDVYEEANTKGAEQFGLMDDLTEVVYSETLTEGDVFVYTFDLATKTVDVKEVIEESVGKITGYKNEKTEDGTIGHVTIDGTKYTIGDEDLTYAIVIDNDGDALDLDNTTADDLKAAAANGVAGTYTYYTLGGKLIAIGEEQAEEAAEVKYLVVKDFTDFELYDHVVMEAFIDGEYEEIKVQKIARIDEETGELGATVKLNTKGYSLLAEELQGLFGIYTYTVDDDGYYTLKETNLAYNVSDFATGTSIKFKDAVQTNAKLSSEESAAGLISRNKMIRINANTDIYLIDVEEQKVTAVTVKTSGEFEIPVAEGATFYADKIGFGKTDDELCDFEHGVASVIYITAEPVETKDYSNHTLIFVQEDVADFELGTASAFEIEDTDEDDTVDQAFVKYDVSDKAFVLSTFAGVDTVYVAGKEVAELPAGAYVVDGEGKIVNGKTLAEIKAASYGNIKIAVDGGWADGGVDFGFVWTEFQPEDFDFYNFSDIRINNAQMANFGVTGGFASKNNTDANVKALHFMELTVDEDEIVTKFYDAKVAPSTTPALIKLMEDYENDTVQVIIAGNYATGKLPNASSPETDRVFLSPYAAIPGNTLNAVILNNIG